MKFLNININTFKKIVHSIQEWISKEYKNYLAHTSKIIQIVSKIIFYILTIGALFCAILIMGLKLATPWFNAHKAVFEQIAEKYMHVPIQIQKVKIEWRGAQPIIVLQNIKFLDKNKKQIIARLNSIRLDINLSNSLVKRQFELDKIEISGIRITAQYFPDGRLEFQDLWNGQKLLINTKRNAEGYLSVILSKIIKNGQASPNVDQQTLKEFFKNIGNVPQLTIRDVAVNFTDAANTQWKFEFPKMHFEIQNNRYFLSGRLNVAKPYAMHANAELVFSGDITNLKKVNAVLYLRLDDINLIHILQKPIKGYAIKKGLLHGSFWLFFHKGEITSVQTLLHLKDFSIIPTNKNVKKTAVKNLQLLNIHHLFGNFSWKKISDGWQIQGSRVFLQTKQFNWPENQFILRWREKNHQTLDQTLWVQYINIAAANNIRQNVAAIIDRHLESNIDLQLQSLSPRGELENCYLWHQGKLQELNHYKVSTDFKNLAWQSIGKIPTIKGFSGHITFNPNSGKVEINSKNLIADFGKLFAQPLSFNQLFGEINWQYEKGKNQWKIHAIEMNALNNDLAFHGNAKLVLEPKKSPVISLLGGFHVVNSTVVKKYLPISLIHPKLKDWLWNAFSGEQPLSGTVILRGSLKDFPFDNNEGVFTVDSNVKDVNLHYEKGWPDIKNIDVHLAFSGRSMSCFATSAEILDIPLTNIKVEIPNMGENRSIVVNAKGESKTKLQKLFAFLRKTPIMEKAAVNLKTIRAKGGLAKLQINLSIPIKKIHQTEVKGGLELKNTDLELIPWHITLNKINGNLSFLNDKWTSEELQANLFGNPVKAIIQTAKNKQGVDVTRINFQSNISTDILEKRFQIPLSEFVSGKTYYQAEMDLLWNPKSTQLNTLTIYSDLKGVATDLPIELKKQTDESLQSQFIFSFGGKDNLQNNLLVKYGDRLTAAFLFKQNKLWSAHLHFGKILPKVLLTKGVQIDGYLKLLNWKNLKAYFLRKFKAIQQRQSFKPKLLFKPSEEKFGSEIKNWLKIIDIHFGQLEINDYTLKQTQLKIKPEKTGWSVTINNKNMAGTLSIPDEWPQGTLIGKFSRLILPEQTLAQSKKTIIKPNDVPALIFDIDYFQYHTIPLGSVHLKTTPKENLLQVDQFNINSPELSARLTGYWKLLTSKKTYSGEQCSPYTKTCSGEHCSPYKFQSHIEGEANSAQFDNLLKKWHIDSSIIANSGYAKINLNWPESIYNIDLRNLQGHVLIKLQNGTIINLSKETTAKLNMGAILNLLSIHNLLGITFADYSKKGYNFDQMNGDLSLKNGLITTNNLYFDGSVAHLDVKGEVNMVGQSLDLYITVIPYLTSSLPVIATIAGGPAAGAITFVVSKLLGKQVGKLTAYKYHVVGTFKHPKVLQQKK